MKKIALILVVIFCLFSFAACGEYDDSALLQRIAQLEQELENAKGDKGEDGKSAYEIWLENGNSGTEAQFLDWLKGETGPQGNVGEQGPKGDNGANGQDGKSAYQVWLDAGNTGTEEEFFESLKGESGKDEFKIYSLGETFTYVSAGIPLFSIKVQMHHTQDDMISVTIKNLNMSPNYAPSSYIEGRYIDPNNPIVNHVKVSLSSSPLLINQEYVKEDIYYKGFLLYFGFPNGSAILPFVIFETP